MTTTTVSSGQMLSGVSVFSGNGLIVDRGGIVIHSTVDMGGFLEVTPGGRASGIVVDGQCYASGAGLIDGVTIKNGGDVYLSGRADNVVISSGSQLAEFAGGSVSAVSVFAGGQLYAGGTIRGAMVSSGGSLDVASGGSVSAATIFAGGEIFLNGGAVSDLTLHSGATEAIYSGVRISGFKAIDGVTLIVSSGATAVFTTVQKGGDIVFAGGMVYGLQVDSGAREEIVTGTTVHGLTVGAGVTQIVSSGATTVETKVARGGIQRVAGTTGKTVLDKGVEQVLGQGIALGTVVRGGTQFILKRGAAISTTISSGGRQTVFAGGVASGTTISGGGTLTVVSGAVAARTRIAGGTEIVSAGGVIVGVTTFAAHATLSAAPRNGGHLVVAGFKETDTIDLTNFKFGAAEKLSFAENSAKTGGVLTITDGALKATVALFGQYQAAGFHHTADGAGTAITYSASSASIRPDIAGGHS